MGRKGVRKGRTGEGGRVVGREGRGGRKGVGGGEPSSRCSSCVITILLKYCVLQAVVFSTFNDLKQAAIYKYFSH